MNHLYFLVFLLVLGFGAAALHYLGILMKRIQNLEPGIDLDETKSETGIFKMLLVYGIPVSIVAYGGYILVAELGWQAHVLDWIHLIVRWFHVVIGIAWIGASFYFIFLENSLNRTENLRDELAGNLWAVHGGGFYYLEKYKTAPPVLPKTLHWFKYEAYFTWLSGIVLLMLVYYFNAGAYMIDPSVADISEGAAIGIGAGTLLLGWLIYDTMCKSPLLQQKKLFALIGFGILVGFSVFLSSYLSGRAAFIHIGALLGTIMAGNVFFVIIPAQKALVKAARMGKPVNPELGKIAGLRSLHNNYTTLPVIFVMISNHFPVTYGTGWNWLILAILIIGSVAVRHYINMHEKGIHLTWMLPIGAASLFAAVIITAPSTQKPVSGSGEKITWAHVEPILKERCQTCHSSHPTDDVFKVAPSGVMFETYEQAEKMSEKIQNRVVETKTMPQGNKTKITDEERALIGEWIATGMAR